MSEAQHNQAAEIAEDAAEIMCNLILIQNDLFVHHLLGLQLECNISFDPVLMS